jgi:hypothetical protein
MMTDPTKTPRNSVDLGSTLVAITLLVLLGVVLAIGAARYKEADLAKLLGALGPLLGIVTGSFVTYFFTRSAVQTSTQAAQSNSQTAETAQTQANTAQARSADLHNALTDVLSALPETQTERVRQLDTVKKVLDEA